MTNQKNCDIIIFVVKRLTKKKVWELSSAGRASALQAEGHRFEPYSSHQSGPVVQLVRTLACHARGREFEPHPGRHFLYASVAQSVEQRTENPRVVGSIPTGGTIKDVGQALLMFSSFNNADLAHLVERHLAKVEVASSSLVIRSIVLGKYPRHYNNPEAIVSGFFLIFLNFKVTSKKLFGQAKIR